MFDTQAENPSRRKILLGTVAGIGVAGFFGWRRFLIAPIELPTSNSGNLVLIMRFSDAGQKLGVELLPKIVLSESDWWSRLTPQQFYVTRKHTTDAPFTGTYYRMHDTGLFRCICCENALFSSDAKYDSGSGWPSFWQPIAHQNVRTPGSELDALQTGIEVLCRRCDAHLGHIFGDGPPPTDLRYCINESSLRFVART